jgi:ABC-type Zn uptake system ZnuABC Zn-binding protein ZnuA
MKFLFLLLAVVFTMASCSLCGTTKCSKEQKTDSLKVVVATDSVHVAPDSVKKTGK